MRRAAMLGLFALGTVAMAFAQTPARSGNQPSQAANTGASSQPTTPNSTPANQQTATQENTQAAPGAAQETPIVSSAANVDRIEAGTEIHAALDTPLSTRTSKPGDRFTASLTDLVRANDGAVVIPSGAHIEGEVAEAEEGKTMAALRGKSALSLRFRHIVLPNGQTLPLTATLVSVHDTRGKNTSGTNVTAPDVGIGAGAGTASRLVFGGPLKGLAIGTLTGGGYVLATKGKDVNLPALTGMVIRLDQPISSTSP